MAGKRIILMYISEISGHHSATLAIEKALKILAPETEILNFNAFNYTNPISEKIINSLYMTVIKNTPQVWEYLYDNPDVIKSLEVIKTSLHKFNSQKFKNLFNKFKPDLVACTQAFPCGMIADYKKIYNSDIPLIAVLTDYVPHSYWIYDTVNYYVTPSEEVGLRLAQKDVPIDRIKPLGIPFDPIFNSTVDKAECFKKLNLKSDLPTLLIMGGGQGLGPIKTIIESLEKIKYDIQVLVITGNNKRLYKSLVKKTKKMKNKYLIFGYVDNVFELMEISNIIITKPGGITTAEALVKKIPMLIISPIPGQEANNTAYLTKIGAAIKVDDLENMNLVIDDLLASEEKLREMRIAAEKVSKPNASFDIAKLLLSLNHV
ncbi:MAG: glycosyltransferase [Candidatus Omnitrophota bacterium]